MMAAGQEDCTEILGTESRIAINTQPRLNLVNLSEATGIRREIPADYYGRFPEAFITEASEFTASCLDHTPPPLRLDSAGFGCHYWVCVAGVVDHREED